MKPVKEYDRVWNCGHHSPRTGGFCPVCYYELEYENTCDICQWDINEKTCLHQAQYNYARFQKPRGRDRNPVPPEKRRDHGFPFLGVEPILIDPFPRTHGDIWVKATAPIAEIWGDLVAGLCAQGFVLDPWVWIQAVNDPRDEWASVVQYREIPELAPGQFYGEEFHVRARSFRNPEGVYSMISYAPEFPEWVAIDISEVEVDVHCGFLFDLHPTIMRFGTGFRRFEPEEDNEYHDFPLKEDDFVLFSMNDWFGRHDLVVDWLARKGGSSQPIPLPSNGTSAESEDQGA